jgi:hypothetical protein
MLVPLLPQRVVVLLRQLVLVVLVVVVLLLLVPRLVVAMSRNGLSIAIGRMTPLAIPVLMMMSRCPCSISCGVRELLSDRSSLSPRAPKGINDVDV